MYEKGYTHGGPFHLDEMATISILKTINPDFTYERQPFRGAEIPEQYYEKDAIIFDVGGGEFDHHDKNAQKEHEDGTLYAACGKVFDAVKDDFQKATGLSDRGIESFYDDFVVKVDAADNGAYCDLAKVVKSFFDPTHPENFEKACDIVQVALETKIQEELAIDRGETLIEHDANSLIDDFINSLSKTDEHIKENLENPSVKGEIYEDTLTFTLTHLNDRDSMFKNMLKYQEPTKAENMLSEITYTGGYTKAMKNMTDYERACNYDTKDIVQGTAILDGHLTTQEPRIKEVLEDKGIHFITYPNIGGTQYNLQPIDKDEIGFPEEWAGYTGNNPEMNVPEELEFVHIARFIGAFKAPEPELSEAEKMEYVRNTVDKVVGEAMEMQGYKLKQENYKKIENKERDSAIKYFAETYGKDVIVISTMNPDAQTKKVEFNLGDSQLFPSNHILLDLKDNLPISIENTHSNSYTFTRLYHKDTIQITTPNLEEFSCNEYYDMETKPTYDSRYYDMLYEMDPEVDAIYPPENKTEILNVMKYTNQYVCNTPSQVNDYIKEHQRSFEKLNYLDVTKENKEINGEYTRYRGHLCYNCVSPEVKDEFVKNYEMAQKYEITIDDIKKYQHEHTNTDKDIVIYDYQGNSYKCNIPDIQDVDNIDYKRISGDDVIVVSYKDGSEVEYDAADISGDERTENTVEVTYNYKGEELADFLDERENELAEIEQAEIENEEQEIPENTIEEIDNEEQELV